MLAFFLKVQVSFCLVVVVAVVLVFLPKFCQGLVKR